MEARGIDLAGFIVSDTARLNAKGATEPLVRGSLGSRVIKGVIIHIGHVCLQI